MDIICPHCKTTLEGDESFVGSDVTCPACNRDFSVPKLVASKQGTAVPKPVASSVVPVGVAPQRFSTGKRKSKGIAIGVAVSVLAALAFFVFLARERTYRARHLHRTVAASALVKNWFSSIGLEEFEEDEEFMQYFFAELRLKAHELIGPWYSLRNIRSMFGDQRVLAGDKIDFEQEMVECATIIAIDRFNARNAEREATARSAERLRRSKANEQYYLTHEVKENVSPEAQAAARQKATGTSSSAVRTGTSTNPYEDKSKKEPFKPWLSTNPQEDKSTAEPFKPWYD